MSKVSLIIQYLVLHTEPHLARERYENAKAESHALLDTSQEKYEQADEETGNRFQDMEKVRRFMYPDFACDQTFSSLEKPFRSPPRNGKLSSRMRDRDWKPVSVRTQVL